jgi:RNA polymerase sigma factor FliA
MSLASTRASEREHLILTHLPQVHLLAERVHHRCPPCVEIDDLISVGTIGLIQAVDRFRPELGLKLKTLAEHRIRGAIADYLRKLDPLPRSIRRFVRERERVASLLACQLGRVPEEAELAGALGLSIERYRRLMTRARVSQTLSIDSVRDCACAVGS